MTLGEAQKFLKERKYERLVLKSEDQTDYWPLSSHKVQLMFKSITVTRSPDLIYLVNDDNVISLSFVDSIQILRKNKKIDQIVITCKEPTKVIRKYVVFAS